jgi:hypothetical protein
MTKYDHLSVDDATRQQFIEAAQARQAEAETKMQEAWQAGDRVLWETWARQLSYLQADFQYDFAPGRTPSRDEAAYQNNEHLRQSYGLTPVEELKAADFVRAQAAIPPTNQ